MSPPENAPTRAVTDHVLALDVGGTGMKAALIGPDGHPLHEARRPTGGVGPSAAGARGAAGEAMAEGRADAALAGLLDFADDLVSIGLDRFGAPPVAAGVVVPGILDGGVVRYAANLGWRDVPLRRLLGERLAGIPVAVGHDVRAGGLAEGLLGAGRGTSRFLFLALGTGIAGAIGIDGRVEAGAHSGAGEIGHIVVRPNGPVCGCGQRGCLETLASASAVGRAWAAVCGDPAADAADAARAVEAGDPRATRVWEEAVAALADGLLTGITLLDPEVVIIGGGLARAGDTLLEPLRTALRERITFQHPPALVPAELGDAAGCLGAGLLARSRVATDDRPSHDPTPPGTGVPAGSRGPGSDAVPGISPEPDTATTADATTDASPDPDAGRRRVGRPRPDDPDPRPTPRPADVAGVPNRPFAAEGHGGARRDPRGEAPVTTTAPPTGPAPDSAEVRKP